MSKIDYQALRELAKQATQGEWVAFISPGKYGTYAVHTPGDNHHGDIVDWPGFDEQKNAENNARYVAAFNPKVALELLGEIKRLEDTNIDAMCRIAELETNLAALVAENAGLKAFKTAVYQQMGVGCDAPEFSITVGLSNLRRFADTLHAIEREFFTKELPDEEHEGETFNECPLSWGMSVEQYVSEFRKCLAEVRAQGLEMFAQKCNSKSEQSFASDIRDNWKLLGEHATDFAAELRKGGNQ
ncbi:ead/Ea22-like family protein [Escherichia coli]|uniref:ead/Ea22-like family protein n=1 Tax=Escherichia coli TaxID=562 RepID=UPI000DA4CF86|nr:ead/Ea22-like family protein [Escherichia coli]SRZ29619.1 EA22-like protein; similarities with EA22 from lambda (modular protein involved in blocking host replication) [Escherichia coli]